MYSFQYSTLVFLLLCFEVSLSAYGYHVHRAVDVAFHDGLATGLREYGKEPGRTAAIDDIQTTVTARKEYLTTLCS